MDLVLQNFGTLGIFYAKFFILLILYVVLLYVYRSNGNEFEKIENNMPTILALLVIIQGAVVLYSMISIWWFMLL